ncbi:tetratricopeptide repeat protein [bacterium]|nr:tetratricopeptide repeat protein [bacterium]
MTSNEAKPGGMAKNIAEALGIEPKQVASLIKTGYVYYEQGRLKEALTLFEAISLLDSLNPYVHGILGSIYQKQQKYDEAVSSYTRALNLIPEDIHALINRGEVYLNQGKLVEATHDFEEAIRLDTAGNHPAANRARLLAILTREALNFATKEGAEGSQNFRSQIINQLSA